MTGTVTSMIKCLRDYEKFLKGAKLSPIKAIRAQCYICNGDDEGGIDCKGKSCPLYRYMSYRHGRIKKPKKILPENKIKAFKDRMKKVRESKRGLRVSTIRYPDTSNHQDKRT